MDGFLNKNQRAVAQLLVLGKSDDEISSDSDLQIQTVKKIKKELSDKFRNLFKYENQLSDKIHEISLNENDIGLLKQIFLKTYFGDENESTD